MKDCFVNYYLQIAKYNEQWCYSEKIIVINRQFAQNQRLFLQTDVLLTIVLYLYKYNLYNYIYINYKYSSECKRL